MTSVIVVALGIFDQFIKVLIGIPPAIRAIIAMWQGLPTPIRLVLTLISLIIAEFALLRAGIIVINLIRDAWYAVQFAIFAVRYATIVFFTSGGGMTFLILAAVAAIVLLITHWKEVKQAISSAWNFIKQHDWAKVLLAISAVLVILIGQFYAVAIATTAWGIITGIAEAVYTGLLLIGTGFEILQAMMGPIGWALIGIGLLIALIVWKWGWIKQAGIDAWTWIKYAAVDAWTWIKHAGEDTFNWIKNHWKLIVSILFGPFGMAVALIVSKWRDLMAFFRRLVGFMGRIAHAILAPFRVVGKIVGPLLGRGHSGSNPLSTGQMRGTAGSPYGYTPGGYTGGMVYSGGIMDVGEHGKERIYVPTGSRIRPAGFRAMPGGTAAAAGAGDILEVHVHSYLDGKEVSENVSKHMANKKARK